MSRIVALNTLEGGITRLRTKGGANPRWLYELENGYVKDDKVFSRPGTTDEIILPAGTRGLCAANGKLVVFAASPVTVSDPRVEVEVIGHPTDPTLDLLDIHFAAPFLGGQDRVYLYVVAEFNDGSVWHFWLQRADTWKANTLYQTGDLVEPSTPNGYVYRATRLREAAPTWEPNVARSIGDVVEPTTFNGYEYTVVDTLGANPRSGATEPAWIAEDGAQVIEDTSRDVPKFGGIGLGGGGGSDFSTGPGSTVTDRYGSGSIAGGFLGSTL